MKNLPHISNELLVHLDTIFPSEEALRSGETLADLWFHKGIYNILSYLKTVKEYQDKNGNILNVQST